MIPIIVLVVKLINVLHLEICFKAIEPRQSTANEPTEAIRLILVSTEGPLTSSSASSNVCARLHVQPRICRFYLHRSMELLYGQVVACCCGRWQTRVSVKKSLQAYLSFWLSYPLFCSFLSNPPPKAVHLHKESCLTKSNVHHQLKKKSKLRTEMRPSTSKFGF